MEDINSTTGDFNAIQLANTLPAAMLTTIFITATSRSRRAAHRPKRVFDIMTALRDIVVSLGGPANGYPRGRTVSTSSSP
jgi:formate--tetrahydrofolate ligase